MHDTALALEKAAKRCRWESLPGLRSGVETRYWRRMHCRALTASYTDSHPVCLRHSPESISLAAFSHPHVLSHALFT